MLRLVGEVDASEEAIEPLLDPWSTEIVADPERLDCLQCGACCRPGRPGTLTVTEADLRRWREAGRADLCEAVEPGHFGTLAFATTDEGACVHLGTPAGPHACRIYGLRAAICRAFPKGSRQCLAFRREAGLDAPRSEASGEPGR